MYVSTNKFSFCFTLGLICIRFRVIFISKALIVQHCCHSTDKVTKYICTDNGGKTTLFCVIYLDALCVHFSEDGKDVFRTQRLIPEDESN